MCTATQEETGYEFTPTHVLGVYSHVREDLKPTRHPLKVIFLGDISVQPISELASDISEVSWFTPEEVQAMDAATLRDLDIKKMVEHYLAGQRLPLSLLSYTISK